MTDNLSAEDRIRKVRISFLRENPFFANISLYLNLIETRNMTMPTMGIDYEGNLYFDPDYVKGLTFSELKGVIAHEVLHICLQHLLRKGSRDKELWNCSTDLAINLILQEQEFRLPHGVLLSDEFNNLSAEEIYDKLYKTAKKIKIHIDGQGNVTIGNMSGKQFDKHFYPKKGENGNGVSGGKDKDYKGKGENDSPLSEREIKKLEDEWKKRIVEAQNIAKSMGSMPAGLERMIGTLLEPKINWKALLYRYITNEIPHDISYSFPHKRSESVGVYLPHTVKENVEIAVSIDSSGSIGIEELNEFLSEIMGISRSFANLNMTVIVCDAKVHDVYDIRNGFDPKDIKIHGGGGTDALPIVRWLEENKPYTKLWIYLTDGYTQLDGVNPFKSLWVISKNGSIQNAEQVAKKAGNITCMKTDE
jgi:predicted metal-dependent peptidase